MVLPLAADQPFWARHICASGASLAPLDVRSLIAVRLVEAVWQALASDDIRQHASSLGVSIRQEAGLYKAIEIITRFAR